MQIISEKVPISRQGLKTVLHMSMLRKFIVDPSYVLQLQTVEFSKDLTYEEYPVAIVDR